MVTSTQHITTGNSVSHDIHPNLTPKDKIEYLLNGTIDSYESSDSNYFVTNVLGNKLCYTFTSTFLGAIKLTGDRFVVFETNKLILFDARNCVSTILIEDDCLNITNPIQGVSKFHNNAEHIYWIDGINPNRFLNISDIPKLKEGSCPETCSDELDCDLLNFNKRRNYPNLILTEGVGNLPNGNYQIAIALTDDKERFTDYYIYPEILRLHSNRGETFGIELEFEEQFLNTDQFELVLIAHRSDRGTLAQRIGYFNNQTTLSITELDETFYTPLDISTILQTRTLYHTAEHIAVNSETLILGGVKEKERFDYRSQANQITSRWKTLLVKADEAYKYPSYMRDEIYPHYIKWILPDGTISQPTHIPPNVVPQSIHLSDAPTNADNPDIDQCTDQNFKYWEIYNTAKKLNTNTITCKACEPTEYESGTFAYWESKDHTYPDDYPDFACQPVKYHKFPDNCTTHIHTNQQCDEPCVSILTVEFDNIQPPVDNNGEPIEVQGYIISVGDRSNHKSILHKGLLFNTGNESIDCDTNALYANYPFNDLQKDVFLGSDVIRDQDIFDQDYEPLNSFNQDKFTYHSPDIHYIKGSRGTELKLYTEQIGRVQGTYHYTEHYPKYQILSTLGKTAAQVAGIVEANIALNGEKCTRTITEKRCTRLAERVTDVENFPVPDTSGGLLANNLANGTGTINTRITTTIRRADYTETQRPVGDCDNPYRITEIIKVNCETGDRIDTSNINSDQCCLKFRTNADKSVSLTITIDNNSYTGVADNNGDILIQIADDCNNDSVNDFINNPDNNAYFTPECECNGDTTEITTVDSEDCEARIDFIKDRDILQQVPVFMYYYTQGIEAVTRFLTSIIAPTNYAVQYTAIADYNGYTCENIKGGNTRRLINEQSYLLPIKQIVDQTRINNWCRPSADYIELDSPIDNPVTIDNTRKLFSDVACDLDSDKDCSGCKTTFPYCSTDKDGNLIQASSYYAGIKRYKPNQYGPLEAHLLKDKTTVLTGTNSGPILGGDIYITKFSVQRKMPFFTNLPLDLPNQSDWDLLDYTNVAFPRFWMNRSQESLIEDLVELLPIVGNRFRDYNLEQVISLCNCGETIDLANLSADQIATLVSIILFLTEKDGFQISDILQLVTTANSAGAIAEWIINLTRGNVTNPFKEYGIFYTHVTGIANFWVESEFINPYREYEETIPRHYPVADPIELADSKEYHLPESFLYNLQYHWKGLSKDTTKVPCNTQDRFIYSVRQDNESTSDSWLIFPPLNYQQFPTKDGKLTAIREIDDYNLFLAFENATYVTQYDDSLTTDSGAQIYLGSPNAFDRRLRKLATEETGYTGTTSPNSIIQSRYGLVWFDDIRKRVFHYDGRLTDITGDWQGWFLRYMGTNVRGGFDPRTKTLYFSDGKWTVSNKPEKNFEWIGFHSFLPDQFLIMSDNFLTTNTTGIWKHNEEPYQTYYNKKYPFMVGLNLNNNFLSSVFQGVEVYSEWFKVLDFDTKIWEKNIFFDKALIWNNCGTTGWRTLKLKDPNDPKFYKGITPVSQVKDFTYRMDEFFFNNTDNQPFFKTEANGVDFTILTDDKDETLRGEWFKFYLSSDDTIYKKLLKLNLNKIENITR